MKKNLLILLIVWSFIGWGQGGDMAKDMSSLNLQLETLQNDGEKLEYIQNYITFSIENGNKKEALNGLELKVKMVRDSLLLNTANTIIDLSKESKFDYYQVTGRFYKGVYYHRLRDFRKAINQFIEAHKISNKLSEEHPLHLRVLQGIALLKQKFGDYEGSKNDLVKLTKVFLKKQDTTGYVLASFSLFNAFNHLNAIDSSYYYVKKAKILNLNNKKYDYLLDEALGIISYYRKDYKGAIEKLGTTLQIVDSIGDYSNGSFSRYYLALSFESKGDKISALKSFKEIDSIYEKHKYLNPDLRSTYEKLILESKLKGDISQELDYIRKLIAIDSANNIEGQSLQNNITKNFDIPMLLTRKNEIISSYEKKASAQPFYYLILIILLTITTILMIRLQVRQKKKDANYSAIMVKIEKEKSKPLIKKAKSNLSSDVVEKLDTFFDEIETSNLFADSEFGKAFIVEHTGVNGHYVTDYLRDFLDTNVITYTNDKRIDLALDKMLHDVQFVKYTLQGMAETIGYNNIQTFNKAFKDRHGMRPYEFLTRLKKEGQNS